MKFEGDEGSFKNFIVCVILEFSLNFQTIPIMNQLHCL